MATSIAADLGNKTRLSAEMDKEYGHEYFLFRQRPRVGKAIALLSSLVRKNGKYVTFLVTRTKDWDGVLIEYPYLCL